MLALQGLWAIDLTDPFTKTSDSQLADLAGNMRGSQIYYLFSQVRFACNCIMSVLVAILTTARFESQSEEEELEQISRRFKFK